jgi:hypothetical protein
MATSASGRIDAFGTRPGNGRYLRIPAGWNDG